MVTVEQVRAFAAGLPRAYEAVVRGRLKFRVGSIVFLSFSEDGEIMGFAFPKEMREALVGTYPEKYLMPRDADLRYNWAIARLDAIDEGEMQEIVLDAWRMVVPKKVAAAHAAATSTQ